MLKKGCLLAGSAVLIAVLMCSSWLFVGIATDGKGLSALAAEPTPTIPAPVVELSDEQLDAIADRLAERLDPGPDLVEIAQLLRDALQPILDKLGEILDLLKVRAASPTIETTELAAGSEVTASYFEVSVPLNCRTGPGMVYSVIGYLSPEEKAEVIGQPTDPGWFWWQVRLPSHPDRVCWASALWRGGDTGKFVGDVASVPKVEPPPVPTPRPEPEEEEDKDRPPACGEAVQESHPATVDEAWTPSGDWRVVNFWSNQVDPNFGDHKLLLEPGQNPGLLGGGSSWSWPEDCEDTAQENYDANGLPAVTLGELKDLGLVK